MAEDARKARGGTGPKDRKVKRDSKSGRVEEVEKVKEVEEESVTPSCRGFYEEIKLSKQISASFSIFRTPSRQKKARQTLGGSAFPGRAWEREAPVQRAESKGRKGQRREE